MEPLWRLRYIFISYIFFSYPVILTLKGWCLLCHIMMMAIFRILTFQRIPTPWNHCRNRADHARMDLAESKGLRPFIFFLNFHFYLIIFIIFLFLEHNLITIFVYYINIPNNKSKEVKLHYPLLKAEA